MSALLAESEGHEAEARPQEEERPIVGFVYDQRMERHRARGDHVEKPERVQVIVSKMKSMGVTERCLRLQSRIATAEEILTGHSKEYAKLLATTAGASPRYCTKLEDKYENDVFINSYTHMASLLALGSTIEATSNVMNGTCRHACAAVRPPGHHATCSKAMGFSFFNNVAVAALLAANGLLCTETQKEQKVLIVDFDVHFGNGSSEMTYNDKNILYFSVHRGLESKRLYGLLPFYPGCGRAQDTGGPLAPGFNVNIAWSEPGHGGPEYASAWLKVLLPIAKQFAPDLILVSAGFDAAIGDPLGESNLLPEHYHAMCSALAEIAPCSLSLEGGYNCNIIGQCFAHCAMAFLGDKPSCSLEELARDCDSTASEDIYATVKAHANFWSCLTLPDKETQQVDQLVNEMTGITIDCDLPSQAQFTFADDNKQISDAATSTEKTTAQQREEETT